MLPEQPVNVTNAAPTRNSFNFCRILVAFLVPRDRYGGANL
jgi:hypothetical protein